MRASQGSSRRPWHSPPSWSPRRRRPTASAAPASRSSDCPPISHPLQPPPVPQACRSRRSPSSTRRNVRPWALAEVENAVVAQSLQLRAAWDTPCVQFGPDGWPLYLKDDSVLPSGAHYGSPTRAYVYTAGIVTADGWSVPFSHEAIEMLVDPTTSVCYEYEEEAAALEVADPVEQNAYRLDGVWVSDFTLPSYFAGATLGFVRSRRPAAKSARSTRSETRTLQRSRSPPPPCSSPRQPLRARTTTWACCRRRGRDKRTMAPSWSTMGGVT